MLRAGVVGLSGLLGGDSDTTALAWVDTNSLQLHLYQPRPIPSMSRFSKYLLVDETSVLASLPVG